MISGFGRLPPDLTCVPPGPVSRWLATELARFESRNVTYLADDFPIFWSDARGANVRDVDGNIYVDLTAAFAVAAAGHSHPEIVNAVREQADRLLHGMGDVHPPAIKVELLRRLAAITPPGLERTILANSGAEAIEAALKTAMLATGKPRVIAFRGGYHGLTLGALAVSGRNDFKDPFARQLGPEAVLLPYPDSSSGDDDRTAVVARALEELEQALDSVKAGEDDVGAVLVEPIQGRGGVLVPPDGWLQGVRKLCTERGLLLILDEIYTGFGRTGQWFACGHSEVVPDLLVLGKALTGGLPFAACIGTDEVMNAWPRSRGEALHTSTFLGHPLGCAAALASIKLIEAEGFVERSRVVGEKAIELLRERLGSIPAVRDVRGRGLMIGIELVHAREAGTPDPALASSIMREMLKQGYLILSGGVDGNVISLSPPLSIDEPLLFEGLTRLSDLIASISDY